MIRRLTSLTEDKYLNPRKWNIHFAYYDLDENGHEKWNHTWDECLITEDELYNLLKPVLIRKEVKP